MSSARRIVCVSGEGAVIVRDGEVVKFRCLVDDVVSGGIRPLRRQNLRKVGKAQTPLVGE